MKLIVVIFVALIATAFCDVPDCATYCGNITAACTGVNEQYSTNAYCLSVCSVLDLGATDSSSETGNTVGCRAYHANVSATVPDPHCSHAGPSGNKTCGGENSTCEAYCTIAMKACVGNHSFFPSKGFCMAACMAFNQTGLVGATSGNSVFCHLYHAGAAIGSTANANLHCPHASPSGTHNDVGVCGTKCENYCQINSNTCTGNHSLYADHATCMKFCETLPVGTNVSDVAGNNLDCRIYHAYAASASANPTLHCPHASHNGGGACGGLCDTYCHVATTYCTGANQLFASVGACMTQCAALKVDGAFNAMSGDSIQCRIYHAGAAHATGNAGLHCPHANITSGGNTCGTASTSGSTTGAATTSSSTGATTTANAFTVVLSFVTLIGFLLI